MEAIRQMAAFETAGLAKNLEFIADYEQNEGFREDGATTIELWLQCALGWSRTRAVDRARMARALRELPCIASRARAYRKQKAKAEAFAFLPMYDPLMPVPVASRG